MKVKESYNSYEMKLEIIDYYGFNGCWAITEHRNWSDAYVIRKTGYCAEIEVKVSKSDLLGENKVIKEVLERSDEDLYNPSLSRWKKRAKYNKHEQYLTNPTNCFKEEKSYIQQNNTPNEFYFAVPSKLGELAKACVAGTPYGVITIGEYKYLNYYGEERTSSGFHILVKAKKLHTVKLRPIDYQHALARAFTESWNYRNELWPDKYNLYKEKNS